MSKQTPQEMVEEFHRVFNSKAIKADGPGWQDTDNDSRLEEMRFSLIEEELDELKEAYSEGDFIETVDALADLVYVSYGAAATIGVDLDDVLEEVHRSNMAKLDDNGNPILREDGKILKPEGWTPPDISGVLDAQRKAHEVMG